MAGPCLHCCSQCLLFTLLYCAIAESPAASGTPSVSATTVTPMEVQPELEDSEPGELTAVMSSMHLSAELWMHFTRGETIMQKGKSMFYVLSLYKLARPGT